MNGGVKHLVPCAPIRRHLEAWIGRHGYDSNTEASKRAGELMSPQRIAIEKLWPGGDWKDKTRSLWAIMHERDSIEFDMADRIICEVLERPWLWYSDPELEDIYQSIDFRGLDATKPTCPKVERAIAKRVVAAFKKTGSTNGASRATGISFDRTAAILAAAA